MNFVISWFIRRIHFQVNLIRKLLKFIQKIFKF